MKQLGSMTLFLLACAASACSSGASPTPGTVQSDLNSSSPLHVHGAILPRLPSTPTASPSTVPANGDVNPYGVAFVPEGFPHGGPLHEGDLLVANFNNSSNFQGTGTTIVKVNPGASPTLFFQDIFAPGFSTALGVLRRGFVIVGNVPSTDGSGVCTPSTVGNGALLVIDRFGTLVTTISGGLVAGPWDLTIDDRDDHARVYVSNVIDATVIRIDLKVTHHTVTVEHETRIASGYMSRCDPSAFVVGPTGLALDGDRDLLYVAATADNKIFKVHNPGHRMTDAGMGHLVVDDPVHLHGPVGLVRAQNGDLISAQGDAVNADPAHPSEIVEFTDEGHFVAQFSVDPAPGSAFGLALEQKSCDADDFRFAAVDDGTNVLDIWDVH
jgi:hypothetical protein